MKLVLKQTDEHTFNGWVDSFIDDLNKTVVEVASATGVSTKLDNYVVFTEMRFFGAIKKKWQEGFMKDVENNLGKVRDDATVYSSNGPLQLKATIDPLFGYASDAPWYFAHRRDGFVSGGNTAQVLDSIVRDELMLYLEAFEWEPKEELVVYLAKGLDETVHRAGTRAYNFGQMMPPRLANRTVNVRFVVADIGRASFIPQYVGGSLLSRVVDGKLPKRLVGRDGEW